MVIQSSPRLGEHSRGNRTRPAPFANTRISSSRGPSYQKSYGICIACYVACIAGITLHRTQIATSCPPRPAILTPRFVYFRLESLAPQPPARAPGLARWSRPGEPQEVCDRDAQGIPLRTVKGGKGGNLPVVRENERVSGWGGAFLMIRLLARISYYCSPKFLLSQVERALHTRRYAKVSGTVCQAIPNSHHFLHFLLIYVTCVSNLEDTRTLDRPRGRTASIAVDALAKVAPRLLLVTDPHLAR